jgi:hypothetical protein
VHQRKNTKAVTRYKAYAAIAEHPHLDHVNEVSKLNYPASPEASHSGAISVAVDTPRNSRHRSLESRALGSGTRCYERPGHVCRPLVSCLI